MNMNESDIALLLLLLECVSIALTAQESFCSLLLQDHIAEQRRLNRSLPKQKTRPTWSHFVNRISTRHFRRMFRMSLPVFNKMCLYIRAKIGDGKFKSEAHLEKNAAKIPTFDAMGFTGGFIPGEVKVAAGLRMMAGGSYLDIAPLFYIGGNWVHDIFREFVGWVLVTFNFTLYRDILDCNWTRCKQTADAFAQKTDGKFWGCIGALDGLAVRIKCPSQRMVPDPGNYFCRKGFYAFNVQAICDAGLCFVHLQCLLLEE